MNPDEREVSVADGVGVIVRREDAQGEVVGQDDMSLLVELFEDEVIMFWEVDVEVASGLGEVQVVRAGALEALARSWGA